MTQKKPETLYTAFEDIDKEELIGIMNKAGSNSILAALPDRLEWLQAIIPSNTLQGLASQGRNSCLKSDYIPLTISRPILIPCPDDYEYLIYKLIPYARQWNNCQKTILMIPRFSPICKVAFDKLSDEEKQGFNIVEYHAEIIPLSSNLFVVPEELAYVNLYCNNDISDIYTIARALTKLQLINGRPHRTFAAGPSSVRIHSLMNDMKKNIGDSFFPELTSYDTFIIIDRNCDKLTPFMTSFNYAAHLDYLYKPVLQRLKLPNEERSVSLEDDPVYQEIKKMTLDDAKNWVQRTVNEISAMSNSFQKGAFREAAGTSKWGEMGIRASKLISIQKYVERHVDILTSMQTRETSFYNLMSLEGAVIQCQAGLIDDNSILDMIRRRSHVLALRLLVLRSIIGNGVPESLLKSVATKMCNTLGYGFYPEFAKLIASGLIKQEKGFFEKEEVITFSQIADLLKLFTAPSSDPNMQPETFKYFMEYIPILIRLVEEALRNQWKPGTPGKKVLDGMHVENISVNDSNVVPKLREPINKEEKPYHSVLVFVVGGVTPGEIEMLSNIGDLFFANKEYTYDVHVASTDIISGERLLEKICPSVQVTKK